MMFLLLFLLALASLKNAARLECYQGHAPWNQERIHPKWTVDTYFTRPQLTPCKESARCCSFESSIDMGRIYECKDKCPKSLHIMNESLKKLGDDHVINYCRKAEGACKFP